MPDEEPVKFEITEKDGAIWINFSIPGGVLNPDDLRRIKIPRITPPDHPVPVPADKTVVLSGRGPLWLYALLAHEFHMTKALGTYEPRVDDVIIVYGDGMGSFLKEEHPDFPPKDQRGKLNLEVEEREDLVVVHARIEGGRFLPISELKKVEELYYRMKATDKGIVLEGPMPVWLATALTSTLVHKGSFFAIYDPRQNGAVVVARHSQDAPEIGTIIPFSPEKKETRVIGVVGDPNSGKSVFLQILNDELIKKGKVTITQEGDLVAPTQNWSLFAPEIRKQLKKEMDPKKRLEWVVKALEGLKKSGTTDFVLVDIGGGRPDLGVRVTEENREILRFVDEIVIVSRNDEDNIKKWLDELEENGFVKKVIGVFESVYPDENGEKAKIMPIGGIAVGAVSYLDRTAYKDGRIPEATKNVVRQFIEEVLLKDEKVEEVKKEEKKKKEKKKHEV